MKLSWLANAYSCPLFSAGDLDELSRSGDLVFDVRSGFASGSVHARLQVSVYSGYDLCDHGCPKIDAYILTPVTLKSRSKPTLLCIHVRCTCTHDAYLVTAGSRDTAHKYFCARLNTNESICMLSCDSQIEWMWLSNKNINNNDGNDSIVSLHCSAGCRW